MRTERKAAAWIGLIVLSAAGCSGQRTRLAMPAERLQLEVPFFPDETDHGGPATMASVLTFWDHPTEPQALKKEAPGMRLKGTIPVELLLAAQERGMQARSFKAGLQDVKDELKLGHPVVAYLNLRLRALPKGRFVVITGYDDGRGGFFVHSSLDANRFVDYGAFMSRWEKTGRWAILVMPAGEPTMSDRSARAL